MNDLTVALQGSKLSRAPLLYIRHVNTVLNKRQVTPVVDPGGLLFKQAQSNTIKTESVVFVLDKKKLTNRRGYKNTRIEFSKCSDRSANYTTTVPRMLQPMYRRYFELIKMSHGEMTTACDRARNNNINYTTYFYGVTNPITAVADMDMDKRSFLNPVFFSSINILQSTNVATQVFSSLTMNCQNFNWETIQSLGSLLQPIANLLEFDLKFNWMCCLLSLFWEGFLDTPTKVKLCWWNEAYYLAYPGRMRNEGVTDWLEYVAYIEDRLGDAACDLQLSARLGLYNYKNIDLCQVVLHAACAAESINTPEARTVASFLEFLRRENLSKSLAEFLACAARLFPVRDGAELPANERGVEFECLRGISEQPKDLLRADGRAVDIEKYLRGCGLLEGGGGNDQ